MCLRVFFFFFGMTKFSDKIMGGVCIWLTDPGHGHVVWRMEQLVTIPSIMDQKASKAVPREHCPFYEVLLGSE